MIALAPIARRLATALAATAALAAPLAAQAQEVFASSVTNAFRGEAAGSLPGWYGGSLVGGFPVALTAYEAQAAVLGAPDDRFASLPGVGPQEPGTAFRGAYIEVGFGSNFGADSVLKVYETARAGEEALLWLWFADGGFLQLNTTGKPGDAVTFDLSPYAALLAAHGGAFTRVGIGGIDLGGDSQGFDLDAVSITAVPEPHAYALMAAGLGLVGAIARKRRG
jgi:hypothetical protein